MRNAEAQDWLRRLMTKSGQFSTHLERVSITNVDEVGNLELPLSPPLTVLSGPNGVGKSVVLKCIWRALDPEGAQLGLNSNISLGRIEVSGVKENDQFLRTCGIDANEDDGQITPVIYIDSGSCAHKFAETWSAINNLPELLDEVSALELEGTDLSDVQYVACREYRYARVYEVDVGYG